MKSNNVENENPDLLKTVEKDTPLKSWLVEYVGKKLQPDNDEVNVEMIVKVVAEDFPEFLLVSSNLAGLGVNNTTFVCDVTKLRSTGVQHFDAFRCDTQFGFT